MVVPLRQTKDNLSRLFRPLKNQRDILIYQELSRPGGSVSGGPQRIASINKQSTRILVGNTVKSINFLSAVAMQDVLQQVIQQTAGETARVAGLMAASAGAHVNRRVGLARVHQEVATHAHQAVLERYRKDVDFNGHLVYRKGRGRLTGKMKQALERPDIIRAGRDGILYGNSAVLDVTAKHWRRLNFGAGAAGRSRVPQAAPFRLAGRDIGGRRLRYAAAPSPAFSMPGGVFLDVMGAPVKLGQGRGVYGFYPWGQALEKMSSEDASNVRRSSRFMVKSGKETRGIRGYQFMEAGLFVIGRELPDAYQRVGKQWITEAMDEVRPRGPIRASRLIVT